MNVSVELLINAGTETEVECWAVVPLNEHRPLAGELFIAPLGDFVIQSIAWDRFGGLDIRLPNYSITGDSRRELIQNLDLALQLLEKHEWHTEVASAKTRQLLERLQFEQEMQMIVESPNWEEEVSELPAIIQ